jgi:predicted transcriptional regulator
MYQPQMPISLYMQILKRGELKENLSIKFRERDVEHFSTDPNFNRQNYDLKAVAKLSDRTSDRISIILSIWL